MRSFLLRRQRKKLNKMKKKDIGPHPREVTWPVVNYSLDSSLSPKESRRMDMLSIECERGCTYQVLRIEVDSKK